jgi:predicted ATPase
MPLWITWGQCIAHYGRGESYLPVLDALGQLCRNTTDARVLEVLKQYAPTWMLLLPAYHNAAEREALQRTVHGATPERMLREIADALEALTAVQPVILLLEDLHWSDMATVDLLAWLALRRQSARLLLVGTYRPVDVIVQQHPLRAVVRELALHELCAELSLDLLNQAEIGQYLSARCGKGMIAETHSSVLYWRTEGNPLFLVTLIEMLERQGIAWDTLSDVEAALREVPPSLRGMVEQQLSQCDAAERRVLEAASVAGVAFAAAAMTAGVGETAETIEHCCSTLASRGQFLQESGVETWPDGTVTARYGFRHVLYQQIIYEQIAPGRRRRLHEQIGHQLEVGFGNQVGERAAELAEHFEHGRDYHRAVQCLHQAAENAAHRSAPREVIALCTRGMTLLDRLSETPARWQQELALHVLLGPALIATHGNADPAVERTYTRAWALCQQLGDTPHIFPVLRGLMLYATNRGEVQRAGQLGEHMLRLAHAQHDQALLMLAHYMMGVVFYAQGELEAAHTHHLQVLAIYTPEVHRDVAVRYGVDPSVGAHFCLAWELWLLGYPDQALHHSQEALRLAQETFATSSLPAASFYRAVLYHFRREVQRAQTQAEAVMTLATAQGLALWLALGTVIHGWAMAMQGQVEAGIVELRQGFDATLATGCDVEQAHILGLLAEA